MSDVSEGSIIGPEEVLKNGEAEPKRLLPGEFQTLEHFRLLKELRDKEAEIVRLKLQGIKDRRKILELTARCYDLDEKLVMDEARAMESKASRDKEDHEKALSEIRGRLQIEGRFGYHPDTLEVHQG